MILQVGVKALILNKKGEVLLLKRSPEAYPDVNNLWDIPGGRINPGVSLSENLKREIEEETGLKMVGEPELVAAQDILRPDKHVVRLTYRTSAEGVLVLDQKEHSEHRWLPKQEIAKCAGLDKYVWEIAQKSLI
ncbi:MAG: NUDIX domain-containing protein [bacterium]|nr:NUDIX domain-containing protein [bacterium]